MCIGVPMQIVEVGFGEAQAKNGEAVETIDTSLVGDIQPDEWVMVFLGAAREKISAEYAAQCRDALSALNNVMQSGGSASGIDHLFADLVNREPELPDFLKDENSPSRYNANSKNNPEKIDLEKTNANGEK